MDSQSLPVFTVAHVLGNHSLVGNLIGYQVSSRQGMMAGDEELVIQTLVAQERLHRVCEKKVWQPWTGLINRVR